MELQEVVPLLVSWFVIAIPVTAFAFGYLRTNNETVTGLVRAIVVGSIWPVLLVVGVLSAVLIIFYDIGKESASPSDDQFYRP